MADEGGFMDPNQGQNPFAAMMSMMQQGMQQMPGSDLGDIEKAAKLEQAVLAYGSRSPLILYKGLLDLTPVLARYLEQEVGEDAAVKLLEVAKEVKEEFKRELKRVGKEEIVEYVDRLYYRVDRELERLGGGPEESPEEIEVKSGEE